jgi:AAA+ ATPase superfamily predicted ATPase
VAIEGLSPDLISALPNLGHLGDEDKREVLDIIDRLQELQSYKNARLNFMD